MWLELGERWQHLGGVEVSLGKERWGEQLVVSHDSQTLAEEGGVFQESCRGGGR